MTTKNEETVGARVAAARTALGLSRVQLGALIEGEGLARTSIWRIENRDRVTADELAIVKAALTTYADDLARRAAEAKGALAKITAPPVEESEVRAAAAAPAKKAPAKKAPAKKPVKSQPKAITGRTRKP